MAVPAFDRFYSAAQGVIPGVSLDRARGLYEKAYGQPGIFTQGPQKRDWMGAATKAGVDEETAERLYEQTYNTLPWYSDVARGVKRGAGNVAATVGGVSHALGAEGFGQSAMDYGRDVQQRNMPEASLAQEFFPEEGGFDPELMTRPEWWLSGSAEVLTSMAPALAAGAVTGGLGAGPLASAAVGGTVGGLQEGFGGTYTSRLAEGVDEDQALREGLSMTAGTGVLNALPLYRIFGKAGGGLRSRAITGVSEGVTELAEEPLEAVITGEDPLEATKRGFGVLPLAALSGGLIQGGKTPQPQGKKDRLIETLAETRDVSRGTPAPPAVRTRPLGELNTISTGEGTQIQAQSELVELDDLLTSDLEGYPAELQPRDRDRDASVLQINDIAQNLEPRRLGPSAEAAYGAPIVGPDNVVESGNARTMALRQVYESHPENVQAYKAYLQELGLDLKGFEKPVLVSRRTTEVDRQKFTLEANQPPTLGFSPAEQARADARSMDRQVLEKYQGGDLDLAKNTDFVRSFLATVPATERNELTDERGRISQVGIRRIQGALLSTAYGKDGELPGLSRMLESTDDNARAITGGLIDAAPYLAELRSRVADGAVAPEYDIGTALAEAAQAVSDARRNKQTVKELLRQTDAFGSRTPLQDATIAFFAGSRSRAAIGSKLRSYAETAQREGDTRQQGMFGGEKLSAEQILTNELGLAKAASVGYDYGPARKAQKPTKAQREQAQHENRLVEGVHKAIDPITRRWRSGPNIKVVSNWRNLPNRLLVAHENTYGAAPSRVNGYRWGDTVYLIADKFDTQADAVRVLAHEAVGHFGMERMLGAEAWAKVQRQVLNLVGKDADITKLATTLSDKYAGPGGQPVPDAVLASEIVANMAERGITHPLIDRILARIREWLRQNHFNVKFTKKDLQAMLANAAKHLEKPSTTAGVGAQASVADLKPHAGRGYRAPGFEGGPASGVSAMEVVEEEIERGWVDGDKLTPELRKELEGRPSSDIMWIARDADYLWSEFGPDKETGWSGLIENRESIEDITERLDSEGWVDLGINDDPDQILMLRKDSALDYQAQALARERHAGQKDLQGEPYFPHVQRVGQAGRDQNERLVGTLHDIIEDTDTNRDELLEKFPAEVVEAVEAITWDEEGGEAYDDYMDRVLANPLASAAKFFDTRDNMRLNSSGSYPGSAKMRQRTYNAMVKAWGSMSGPKPPLLRLEDFDQVIEASPSIGKLKIMPISPNPRAEPYIPRRIDVMTNPNKQEIRRFVQGIDSKRSDYPDKWAVDNGLRYWKDPAGNWHFWDAEDAIHVEVIRGLGYEIQPGMFGEFSEDLITRDDVREDNLRGYTDPNQQDLFTGQASIDPQDPYQSGMMRNMRTMSRTLGGVLDAAGSETKAANLEATGAEAATRSLENIDKAWQYATNRYAINSGQEMGEFITELNRILTAGVVKSDKIRREHDVKGRYVPVDRMDAAFAGFATELQGMLDTAGKEDLASFIWQRFNHEIHPFTDAVGKTTEILTDWALQRRGLPLPVMPERGYYFDSLKNKDAREFRDFFKTLFPTPAHKLRATNSNGAFDAFMAELPPGLQGQYRKLLEDEHINDLAIEFHTGLDDEAAWHQLRLARQVLDTHQTILVKQYSELKDPEDTKGGRVQNVDAFRELYGPYVADRTMSGATHEVSSAWIKDRAHTMMGEPAGPGFTDSVLILGGGSGVGKSTALKAMHSKGGVEAKVVLDSVMSNFKSAQTKINQALDTGNDVDFMYVHRDLVANDVDPGAWNGVIVRAIEEGRTVSVNRVLANAIGSRKTVEQLMEFYADNPRVQFTLIDNSLGYQKAAVVASLKDLPELESPDILIQKMRADLMHTVGNGVTKHDGATLRVPRATAHALLNGNSRVLAQDPAGQADAAAAGAATAQASIQGELPGVEPRPRPAPENRPRLKSGGGSYSPVQFATLNDQEFEILERLMQFSDPETAAQRSGRDPKTWNETEAEALEAITKDPAKTVEALTTRGLGATANAAELESYGMILNSAVAETQKAAEKAALTGSDDDLAIFLSQFEKLSVLQAPYAGYMTEAGRALNILAKGKAANLSAQKILESLPEGIAVKLKGSTTGNRQGVVELARQVAEAEDASEVAGQTRKLHKPDMFDKVYEYWVNSILSGLNTHAVNNLSNYAFQTLENVSRSVGGVLPGGSVRATNARWVGGLHGIKLGAKLFKRAFITGQPQLNQTQVLEHRVAIPGVLGDIIRLPGRALVAEDEFWKGIAYYSQASELAMLQAQDMGGNVRQNFADIMANLEEHKELVERAKDEASRLTFTTELGPNMKALNRALIKSRFGKYIAPFIRTPSNILKEAIRFTPGAGMAIQKVRDDMAGRNGANERAIQAGRWIVGSGVYLAVGLATAAGQMSGAGPDDFREKRLLQRTGWQPYSIRHGDKWIKYNRFEPVGMLLGLSADAVEISHYAQGGELDKLHAMIMGSLMSNLGDKTFLSGVFDFAEAISDPQRHMGRWAARMAQSFAVPNAIGQAVWTADPYVREARTIADRIQSRVPGQRQKLEAMLDVAGEPIPQTAAPYGAPFHVSQQRDDILASTMLRLGLFKGKPGRTLMNVKLDDETYSGYAKAVGNARWQVLTPHVKSPQFQAMMQQNPELARAILDKLWTRIGSDARTRFLYENPEILVKSRQAKFSPRAIGSDYL